MILNLQILLKITRTFLKVVTSLIASLIITPFIIILTIILTFYKQCLWIILKIRYGQRFKGLLGGADVVHTMEKPSKAIISCLLIIGYNPNYNTLSFYDNTIILLRHLWFKRPDSFPKFKSIFLKAMGYSYRLRDYVTPDECLRKMKTVNSPDSELNKTEMLELIADCCNTPLPRNERVLWEVLVGTQALKWKSDPTKKYYPILFRVHHGVADGVSLLKLLIGVFADNPQLQIVSSTEYKQLMVSQKVQVENKSLLRVWIETLITLLKYTKHTLEQMLICIRMLVMYPAVCFIQLALKCNDNNILHGPKLTDLKVLALTMEENPKYIEKIKEIKSKLPGTSFSIILTAAFSASLTDYYAKKSLQRPEYISSLVPVLPGSLELQYMIPGQLNENSLDFKNGYSFLLPTLPLFIREKSLKGKSALLERIQLLKNQMEAFKKGIDYQVNYFMMCVLGGILPQPVIRLILKGSHCTTLISIIAGPQNMTFGGGIHSLENMAFWVPHLKNVGVSFSALTYRNRLHVGLSADKALISQQSDAQSIVDGVFKYLDDIENEVNALENL